MIHTSTPVLTNLRNLQCDFNENFLKNPILIDCQKIKDLIREKQKKLLEQTLQDPSIKPLKIQKIQNCNVINGITLLVVMIAFGISMMPRIEQNDNYNTSDAILYSRVFQFLGMITVAGIAIFNNGAFRKINYFNGSKVERLIQLNRQYEGLHDFICKFEELISLKPQLEKVCSTEGMSAEDIKEEVKEGEDLLDRNNPEEIKIRFNIIVNQCIRSYINTFETRWNKDCYEKFLSMAINNLQCMNRESRSLKKTISVSSSSSSSEELNLSLYREVVSEIRKEFQSQQELSLLFLQNHRDKLIGSRTIDIPSTSLPSRV